MIVNGKQIADSIKSELITKVNNMQEAPALHIFVVGENPVIEGFVKYKKSFAQEIGVEFIEHRFTDDVNELDLVAQIKQVRQGTPSAQGRVGIVVQLPLPSHLDTQVVLDAVPVELDVDGLSTGSPYLTPVAGAVQEILNSCDVAVNSKKVLVIGKGRLVGRPVAELLESLGAEVTTVDKTVDSAKLTELALKSGIIVSGAGVPNLVTPEMVSEGAVLIDAGTSTQGGHLVGDIALECETKASCFAKTPGGIGPITIAMLFKNLIGGVVMTK